MAKRTAAHSPAASDESVSEAASPVVAETVTIGTLYLVATPIGNLEDITMRALRILRQVDLIAAEDTRVTRKLLSHFDIHTILVPYHAHSSDASEQNLIARLVGGENIALVSDAGTPCLSDPGAELVAGAIAAGIRVEPIPGACAAVCALIASGIAPARFVFEGFLPRTRADRRERIRQLLSETRTVVVYEAPPRLVETLIELRKADESNPNRKIAVGREITKKFEEFVRGTFADVIAHFETNTPRGECVVVLEGAPEAEVEDRTVEVNTLLRDALERGLSPRDAAREIAAITKLPRNEIYARLLEMQRGESEA